MAGLAPPPRLRLPAPLQTLALSRDPLRFLSAAQQRHGDCFTIRPWPLGELVVVADPAEASRFLLDANGFHAGRATRVVLPILGSRSILALDGNEHRRRRQRLLPLFTGAALNDHREWMADVVAEEIAQWREGPLRILPCTRRLALRIACRIVLGIDDSDEVAAIEAALRRMLTGPAALASWTNNPTLTAPYRRRRADLDHLLLELAVHRHRGRGHTAVERLLDDPELVEPAALLEELRALLIVGHETSACAMAWALERLAWHPQVAERLRAELSAADERYLDAVVRETLRTRPPVVDAVRSAARDSELCGHRITKGTILLAAPPLIHRRADEYPEPDRFLPDRFLGTTPPRGAYIPFGAGARRCLGAPLAMREVAALLAEAVRDLRLRPLRQQQESGRLIGTAIAPARGGELQLERRPRATATCPIADRPRSSAAHPGTQEEHEQQQDHRRAGQQ